jgi:hypothetical protein
MVMETEQKKPLLVELIFLVVGSFAVNFALMYWWWARIYLFTGTLLSLSLLILMGLNPIVLYLTSRKFDDFIVLLNLQKRSLLIPIIIGVGFIFVHLFGVTDTTVHRYLYRNVYIMIGIGMSVIFALILKWIEYNKIFERRTKEISLAFFLDLVSIVIFALILTNIEGLLA